MRNLCGTDIIEIERIKKVINSLENTFINKIYTENEIKYCEEKNNAKLIDNLFKNNLNVSTLQL